MIVDNPYQPMLCKLVDVIEETPTIKTFVIEPPRPFAFRAGQFAQVGVPGVGESPFTPSSNPSEPERLEFTVIRTGRVTEVLHAMKPGAELGLRGPFGQGYPVDELADKHVFVVGGGCGLAPLRSLIFTLLGQLDRVRSMRIKYGARESREILYRNAYEEWARHAKVDVQCTIDVAEPGWSGKVGVVTTLLNEIDVPIEDVMAVSCGPEIMLKFVTQTLLERGLKPEQIILSMNRRMSCGIGKCGRCNIGPYYLCRDGPDISYAKIKDFANVF
ncbi:MAG: FAD/NAD(P)-binding protein [Phycisphaerae bacterium]|nr:FAD/NAD(P)-binding protein [Phycisphaerae bacterium]